MPSKRKLKHRDPRYAITPRAVELWRKLYRARSEDVKHDLVLALQRELRLPPWIESPWSATGSNPYTDGCAGQIYWPLARALRRALQAAATGKRLGVGQMRC